MQSEPSIFIYRALQIESVHCNETFTTIIENEMQLAVREPVIAYGIRQSISKIEKEGGRGILLTAIWPGTYIRRRRLAAGFLKRRAKGATGLTPE